MVLIWLRLIHQDLPRLVKQRYGPKQRSRTLASIKPEISQALPLLINELRTCEDARVMRTAADRFRSVQSPLKTLTRSPNPKPASRVCPLYKQSKRPKTDHFLSACPFLPEQDRQYILRARIVTGVYDLALSENSEEEEIGDPGYDIPYTTGPSEPATVRRVMIKESPHLNMFHGHVPIQVTLDSGATGNLISSHAAKHIKAHIRPTSQCAHQADGNSPLEVVRETHLTLTMDHKVFHFERLVVNNLDGDNFGGVPFMAHNDIGVRPARREVVFGDGSAVTYPSDNTTGTPTIRRAIVLRAPSHSSTIWPGEYISIDIPSNQCTDRDQSYVLEPRYDSKSSHDWLEPQVITSVGHTLQLPNLTGSPVVIKKHDHFCQVRQIFPSNPNEDIPLQPTDIIRVTQTTYLLALTQMAI